MALFPNKQKVAPSPQQILLSQFPRNVNSLAKRMTICDQGATDLEHSANAINTQLSESITQTEIGMKEQLHYMNSLKESMAQMDKYLIHLIQQSNKKVSLKNFDRASAMIDKYDFAHCCTRRNFRQKLTFL